MRDGSFLCEYRIQDGTERFTEKTLNDAIHGLISAARAMNGSFITEKNIEVRDEVVVPNPPMSDADAKTLSDIRRGVSVLLDAQDKRIRYRITDEDCELIVRIREGRYQVSEKGYRGSVSI
jgi:hypothetical protein